MPNEARPPQRVRVTSTRSTARPAVGRPIVAEIGAHSELGSVYVAGLIRAQLRLSLLALSVMAAGLILLPLVLTLVPAVSRIHVVGVPLAWLVVGVGIYPLAWLIGRWYRRSAERLESQFVDAVES